jgi:hypothetical protein
VSADTFDQYIEERAEWAAREPDVSESGLGGLDFGERVLKRYAWSEWQAEGEELGLDGGLTPEGYRRWSEKKFNPSQPRDGRGRWSRTGGGAASVVASALSGALPGSKPGKPHAGGMGKPGGHGGGMSEPEFEARKQRVEKVIGDARKTLSTDVTHAKDGVWNEDRARMHREIADELYAKAANVPNEGRSVIAGGLGGAGKTTVLRDHAGIDPSQYLTVNPDDIKELMAERGLVPEVPGHPDLSPMERAALVHEESSLIGKMLADKAYRDKKNMIWDITMASEGSAQARINDLKKQGYKQIEGVFVDIPVETSVERAMSRYRRGIEQWHNGSGLGGRYVPPSIIRAQKTSTGQSINREVFDRLAGQFDGARVYDNSVHGRAPVLVSGKGA